MATTNYTLTNIALKRVSGKAQVSINNNVNQELIGSSIQSSNSTVFGESVPNAPSQTLYLVQSSSVSDPGTVMYAEFKVYPIGDSLYGNDPIAAGSDDEGDVATNTYHAYALYLSSAFDDNVTDFNTHASTGTSFGSFPFVGGSYLTGSAGKFQLVPSFLSTDTSTNNAYIPTLYSNEGAVMQPSDPSDWYLDPFSGILFIQDPTQYGIPNGDGSSPNTSTSIPGKIASFMYVGKYQDEITFSSNDVGLHISASEGTEFSLSNNATASFESGSAGITVTAGATNTITIGANTDNVTFNQITASIINVDTIEASEYIVSSSITYMTQSFSSGSTIFGDSNDDTHKFTGSLYIIHTGSDYGITLTGSGLTIDSGDGVSISASGFISASDLYLTDTLTALDGGVTVRTHDSVELYVDGNITASGDISASGLLFASASDDGGSVTTIAVAMYDTASGRLYYTSSNALGDTTLLEASASAGIAVSSSGGVTSIALTETASFEGDSTTGITVTNTAGTITITATPDTLVAATSDTANFEFTSSVAVSASIAQTASFVVSAQTASYVENAQTASYVESALSSSTITVTDNEDTDGALPIVFHDGTAGNSVNLQSDESAFTYNPNDSTYGPILTVGDSTNRIQLGTSSLHTTTDTGFDLLNTTVTTINIGGDATTISMGASTGTVTINGSASIAGDLIVQGTTTSINTDQLNVEDPFILLNSSSTDPSSDGGVIVQTDDSANGTALFYDNSSNRWAIAESSSVAWNVGNNTAVAHQYVVSVSQSGAAPSGDPSNFGLDDATRYGMMYVDTSDTSGDGGLYIYLP